MMEQATCQGNIKVVQQSFSKKYPLVVHSHCCSHALNLVAVKACSLIQVQNLSVLLARCTNFLTTTQNANTH